MIIKNNTSCQEMTFVMWYLELIRNVGNVDLQSSLLKKFKVAFFFFFF